MLRDLLHHADPRSARPFFDGWDNRMIHTKLNPLKMLAKTIRERRQREVTLIT